MHYYENIPPVMSPDLLFDSLSIKSDNLAWPFTIPAIHHIAQYPLHFDNHLTIIVGDNGSGKSTFMEALAEKISLRISGGPRFRAIVPMTSPLAEVMEIHYTLAGLAAVKCSKPRFPAFFLRSETDLAMMEAVPGSKTTWGMLILPCYHMVKVLWKY